MKKIVFVALALMASASAAWCHAMLSQAEPRVGSTVKAPREVILTFSEGLEAAFSRIEVRDPSGKRIDSGKTSVSGGTMRIPVRASSPGTYKVNWRALSVDTHKTEGSFSFTVQP